MSNSSLRKRGVIYARVSSEEQRKSGYSLDSQIKLLEEKMKRDNVIIFQDSIIDIESGRNFEREGLNELLKLAKSGSINYIYVYDLDRLGRNVIETPYLMYTLKIEMGIVTRTISEEFNFNDPIDYVLAVLKCYPGDVESRNLGERTQRGKIEKFKQGKWISAIPLGFKKNVHEELEKIPEFEPIITYIFQTYENENNFKEVTQIINKKYSDKIGVLTTDKTRRVLTNTIYKGYPKYGETIICNPKLSMVNSELFDNVQLLIQRKARKSKVKKERKPRSILDNFANKFGIDHVMRVLDILKPICPKCHTKMVGNGSKDIKGLEVPNFICPNCRYHRTIPLASELERFQDNLLSCPSCRSVENFDIRRTMDSFNEYTCRRCDFSFIIDIHSTNVFFKNSKIKTKGKGKKTRKSHSNNQQRFNAQPKGSIKHQKYKITILDKFLKS